MTAVAHRQHGDSRPLPFTPTPWATDGACHGKPTALWFPVDGDNDAAGVAA